MVFLNGANSIEGSVQLVGGLLALGNGGALGNGFALLSGGVLLATTTQTLTTGMDFSGTPTIAAAPGQTLSLQGEQQLNGPVTLTFGEPGENDHSMGGIFLPALGRHAGRSRHPGRRVSFCEYR